MKETDYFAEGGPPPFDDNLFVPMKDFVKLQEAVMKLQAHLIAQNEIVLKLLKAHKP